MTKLRTHRLFTLATFACLIFVFCTATAVVSPAQVTFTTLLTFGGTNGSNPTNTVLTQGADGNFYGVTPYGGVNNDGGCYYGCGTVFKMTASGALTTLYNFCSQANCTDGYDPTGSLAQAANGDFYGTTIYAGANGGGTVFEITTKGELTTLYSFCTLSSCADGEAPNAGLVRAGNGSLYGTTAFGGVYGAGTVFEITPAGELRTLYSFCAQYECADGSLPDGGLIQAIDGNFYGETEDGGLNYQGTVFKVTPAGKLTTLYSFCALDGCSDGSDPYGGLVQATNGDFYGSTLEEGGDFCACGTVFKITSTGGLATLHTFDYTDGRQPSGGLVQGTDGNLYGTTKGGGPDLYGCDYFGCGTVFEITPAGTLTTLYNFCALANCADGAFPTAGLLQATNGAFYGTTAGSITLDFVNDGTIFSLSTGLGPFVKTQPASGKEGNTIGIFGQGFSSSSVVQFGGVQATNIKLSGSTFLFATVPAGALTGPVTVTTDGTTLTSNQEFRVTPQLLSFNPPSGAAGTQVTITGTGFTQTVGVGFGDNSPAEFTVNSDTQITATVPTGAATGPVGVVTKGGTAISSATFTVN
jgi:uncharacterized repeat protein (TIGR03803 family)